MSAGQTLSALDLERRDILGIRYIDDASPRYTAWREAHILATTSIRGGSRQTEHAATSRTLGTRA